MIYWNFRKAIPKFPGGSGECETVDCILQDVFTTIAPSCVCFGAFATEVANAIENDGGIKFECLSKIIIF